MYDRVCSLHLVPMATSPRLAAVLRSLPKLGLAARDASNCAAFISSLKHPTTRYVANFWDGPSELQLAAEAQGFPISVAAAIHIWREADLVCEAAIQGRARAVVLVPHAAATTQSLAIAPAAPVPKYPECIGWKRKASVGSISVSSTLAGGELAQHDKVMIELWGVLVSMGNASSWHVELGFAPDPCEGAKELWLM